MSHRGPVKALLLVFVVIAGAVVIHAVAGSMRSPVETSNCLQRARHLVHVVIYTGDARLASEVLQAAKELGLNATRVSTGAELARIARPGVIVVTDTRTAASLDCSVVEKVLRSGSSILVFGHGALKSLLGRCPLKLTLYVLEASDASALAVSAQPSPSDPRVLVPGYRFYDVGVGVEEVLGREAEAVARNLYNCSGG